MRVGFAGCHVPVDRHSSPGASAESARDVLVPFHPLGRRMVPLIWLNGPFWLSADRRGMKPAEEPRPGKVEQPPKLSRSEEARRIIEEYADCLREIIKKLRRRLN